MPQATTAMQAALAGLALGGSLIVAIGAQNAFILRQGLARSHVFILCLICSLSDLLLIMAGIAGFGTLLSNNPLLITIVRYAGAAFLAFYGLLALHRALHPHILRPAGEDMPLKQALLTVLGFTFLNPHVYLDTVVLIGGLSTQYGSARWAFGAGAGLASFIWFYSLGYGARLLAPLFARPASWRILDGSIAFIMIWLALRLLTERA